MSADAVREQAPPARSRGRRAYLALGILILVVVGGIGAYSFATANREGTDDAVIEADVVAVTSRVPGLVSELLVKDNQTVKAGEAILQLDSADLSARVAQARADLQTAEAQAAGAHAQEPVVAATARGGLESAQAQESASGSAVQAAEAQIAVAQAAVARAQAEADKADRDLARARELVASDAIARQQLDSAQLASDSAHAALRQSQAGVTAAQEAKRAAESHVAEAKARVSQTAPVGQQIQTAKSAVSLADARVAAAAAALRLAELQLSYTKVIAPSDGIVLSRVREPGAIVSPSDIVYTVSLTGDVWVRAYIAEPDLGHIHPGMTVEITTDTAPGKPYTGRIGFISPVAEFTPKSVETPDLRTDLVYRLRVIVDRPDSGLRQGMPVTIRLPQDTATARAD